MTAVESGRVAIVTGGGSGIGAAIVRRFAAEGLQVVAVGRDASRLERIAAETGADTMAGDVSRTVDAERIVSSIMDRYGRLDSLIANAGGHGYHAVGDTTDEEWAQSMRGNLDTAFVMARAAIPPLVDTRGSMVLVSSLAGLFAGPSVAAYTVAKHAMIGLSKSMARDYGPRGVRVNAICPGWVRTPMADAEMAEFAASRGESEATAEDGYRLVSTDVPLRRVAEPAEIASAVWFLTSDDASFISGATLVVDGGAHVVDVPTIEIGRLE
ncbi:SDR family NAD(P)-dependent oxidoreductase [Mycobacterium sp. AT1]|uniref:SDR family NAD(P)-dependent oxidoreductase n=1 Tax=Mycobacterium sp. AT1 TaxID=1961706 RepID=UPI0009AC14CC|nr:SDR family oxidoreductase [Mycobacterium sp. AT1]OPX10162.1 3-oxoacyl-ACP reductase [Mycobacterium sp. AT1]